MQRLSEKLNKDNECKGFRASVYFAGKLGKWVSDTAKAHDCTVGRVVIACVEQVFETCGKEINEKGKV